MSDINTQIEALSGIPFPPKSIRDAVTLLLLAGFSQDRIDQYLCHCGFEGFEKCGELPNGYTSVGVQFSEDNQIIDERIESGGTIDVDAMLFSERVLTGLKSRKNENTNPYRRRRELGDTVEKQMLSLLAEGDEAIPFTVARWANLLDCSESAVKKKGNKAWEFIQKERGRGQVERTQSDQAKCGRDDKRRRSKPGYE